MRDVALKGLPTWGVQDSWNASHHPDDSCGRTIDMPTRKPRAEVPGFIIDRIMSFREPAVWDDELVIREDILYAVGGALLWMRLAASFLEEVRFSQHGAHRDHVARYHTYAGVSAAHTCIDTIAVWVYECLRNELPPFRLIEQSLNYAPFFRALIEARPNLKRPLERLRSMLALLGDRRQAAQHRGDVRVLRAIMSTREERADEGLSWARLSEFEDRWYFVPADPSALRAEATRTKHDIVYQLRDWANRIERELRVVIVEMPQPPSIEPDEMTER